MKISVDGGGLGGKLGERFGNYVFSENLIRALSLYDKKNKYHIYTFDRLKPRLAWSKIRLSLEEFKEKKDVFLALNQAIPLYVSEKIISFCHGLSYYFYPRLYSKKDYSRLMNQLKEMIKRSDYIVVSSEKVKKELVLINQLTDTKIVVIPFGIPIDMSTRSTPGGYTCKYFLYVGMKHSIKNIRFIRKAFEKFREIREFRDYQLTLITKNCSRKKLRNLYRGATALLTASHYESFNLPVLEALSLGCPVVGLKSAIIPELQPYVNLANNQKEFIDCMYKVINQKKDFTLIKRLIKVFSWKNYVEKLVKLYK
ncbi:hypothetical protein COW98_02525 [Candidatus Roizmanbacteria bacterium CG22_combo_CG10-13_8_21_14_all_35_9]|uniref:Glycosyl transferase family 1 domain-containing protein n=4 Tax=Candidatus Roizmaniibacteriota TaxID=1752723 RepID=A0A2M8F3N7_9BACT|nr:MAG: hypothetical protein COX47_02635 [Candidatus Roizmanbacteria bacterium CG23_combo_of_CG06-09_8_20_14_all_35_49]PIP62725.1 MAG: hypothetical protein COW98_02525 [Candidatus Roizmanbacteria bacterium CG22_combo_CG10-13_8_21_14_all_35_9]PIY70876.1 MAG: hypothetical protein COY88_03320 [Candidatus Roizmanbacteria bacterium CG_4_10_14_0_8_um_filter_35_28]PJC33860.1 MAG: hypothetical protein CO048_02095 [Candidatus Roizmanbacteria bacterium CG_4_9_14_0_2_um_filter_35_15]PJC82880.1 MAG: hypoth